MKEQSLKHERIQIAGMTCTSCEVIIERRLKQIPGVKKVSVHHTTGWCDIYQDPKILLYKEDVEEALQEHGYSLKSEATEQTKAQQHHWREFGVALLVLFVVYKLLQALGIFSLSTEVDQTINLGAIFIIGLVAAVSTCTALVSGLILSVSAKYNVASQATTKWQRFKPHLLFNIGRLISYFVLGGVIGVLGKAITPSPRFTGILTILISFVMILLGIDILKLFQSKRFIPKMPKWFSEKMYALADSDRPWVPFVLGGLTFFLPCGFTQSMQLYALTTGSFIQGGLTMLVFALGTLPALLGVGMLASMAKGKFTNYFMKFSGAMVLVLGIYNLNNGLALADIQPSTWISSTSESEVSQPAELTDGVQVVRMAVDGISYVPRTLTVRQGVPVEWHIDASEANGCTQIITIPEYDIVEQLSYTEDNVITFTPTKTGQIGFACGMGMARGSFTVIP